MPGELVVEGQDAPMHQKTGKCLHKQRKFRTWQMGGVFTYGEDDVYLIHSRVKVHSPLPVI